MTPADYKATEWQDLLRGMNTRQIRKSLKGAVRSVARKVRQVALRNLASSGLQVEGNTRDWKAGLRARVYPDSKGTGFMLTVKPERKDGKGYHAGRRYGKTITRGSKSGSINKRKLPVLMWAEDGTRSRNVGGRKGFTRGKSRYTGKTVRHYKRGGHSTGKMPVYGFLEKSEPEAFRIVEGDLAKALELSVVKVASKAGFK